MAVTPKTSLDCCKVLTIQLDGKENLPNQFLDETGVYAAVTSPQNKAGYEGMLSDIRTQIKDKALPSVGFPKIQVQYTKPDCDETTTDCTVDVCKFGTQNGDPYGYMDVTLEKCVAEQFTISRQVFDNTCYGKSDFLAMELDKYSKKLLRKVNKALTTDIDALMGNYFDGTSSSMATKQINLINSNGAINPAGIIALEHEYEKLGTSGNAIVVGGTYLSMYNKLLNIAAPNYNTGLDATKLSARRFFYDTKIDSLLSPTGCKALTWAAGGIQLIEGYKYDGDRRFFSQYDVKEVRTLNGITFDYAMHYDACSDNWVVTLIKYYDLFYVPTSEFTCLPAGANHKLKFTLGCGDMDCATLGAC